MPEISVIVPVYKVEPYLERCIDSILNQTFRNYELILVDDGSPDRCPDICEEYKKKDDRVIVIHQLNGGLSAARNRGIEWAKEHSDSCWISFVDGDDWVHPRFLEILLYAAKEKKVSVSCCQFHRIRDNNGTTDIQDIIIKTRPPEEVYCSSSGIGVEAYSFRFLYEKKLFCNVSFPIGKIYEDLFTTPKLIFQSSYIADVNQKLYYYFYREDSLSHSVWTPRQLDIIEAYEENLRYFTGYSSKKLMHCLSHGYLVELHSQYLQLQRCNIDKAEKKRLQKMIKRKIRFALVYYAKTAGINLNNSSYIYAAAYPYLTNIYWFLKGQISKLK